MNKLIRRLINGDISARSNEFKECLNKADVTNLTGQTLFDSEMLSEIDQIEIYFILEYKLAYLMKNGTKYEIAYLSYLISVFLFMSLTPIFARELAIKYAEDACQFNNKDEYIKWLEYIVNEDTIC